MISVMEMNYRYVNNIGRLYKILQRKDQENPIHLQTTCTYISTEQEESQNLQQHNFKNTFKNVIDETVTCLHRKVHTRWSPNALAMLQLLC